MDESVQDKISQALKEGYNLNEVATFLSKSKDESHKQWADQWFKTAASPSYIPGTEGVKAAVPEGLDPEVAKFYQEGKAKQAAKINQAKEEPFDVQSFLTRPDVLAGLGIGAQAFFAGGGKEGVQSLADKLTNRRVASQIQTTVPDLPETTFRDATQTRFEKQRPAFAEVKRQLEAPQLATTSATQTPVATPADWTKAPVAMPPPADISAGPVPPAQPAPLSELEQIKLQHAQTKLAIDQARLAKLQQPATATPAAISKTSLQDQELLARSASNTGVNQSNKARELAAGKALAIPDATPQQQAAANEVIAKQIEGKTGAAVKPEMSVAGKKAMEQFGTQYPNVASELAKEGKVGLLGFGSGDISLYNTYGAEGRKAVLEHFNKGQPLGPHDPNYETLMAQVRKGVPPNQVPGLMAQLPSEAEAGNYGKAEFGKPATINPEGKLIQGKNQVNKLLKAGGPAILMMALADAAKASESSQGNKPVGPSTSEGGAAFGGYTSGKKYQKAKKQAEQADVNLLKDPKTAAAVMGLLGTSPDQMGFSVLNPKYKEIMNVAEPAYYAGLPLGFLPGVKAKKIAGSIPPR